VSALELLAGLMLPEGRRFGEMATSWERRVAKAMLSERGARRWWVGAPRGAGKTEFMAALTTVAMVDLLRAGAEAYVVARDRDQARISIDRVRGFVRRSGLEGAFERLDTYVVTTRSGVRLEALSADVGSAWGLSPAWAICDELCQWPETQAAKDLFDAVLTGLPKVADSRFAIITTAGSPGHFSRSIYERAEREPRWRVVMSHAIPPRMDPAEVADAKRSLPASSFARLFENRFAQGEDRLFDPDDIAACISVPGPLDYVSGHRYAIGVDAALRRNAAAVAVAHRESDRVVVDRLDVFVPKPGRDVDLSALEDLVAVRARQYSAPVVFDPAMLQSAAQRLHRQGVRMIEHAFTVSSNSTRTLALLRIVREHHLAIPDDRELIDELLNLRIREVSPGVFRHDHDPSKHDDRCTAVSLAVLHLLERAGGPAHTSARQAAQARLPSVPASLVAPRHHMNSYWTAEA
jgi:phage terminase large subunit-like protein